ncbi:MAG TPA: hydrogenase maturation protease [Acidimicrobiales bacterium]|nr:hydrogenase maturation protease [Acidimicrobiales bacterium]
MTGRVLIAGVGNIFLGDDGFGAEVARRLIGSTLPAGIEVGDFGIRGIHLAYQLLDGYDALILVDAVQRGDAPGTVSVIEPEDTGDGKAKGAMDGHDLDPVSVLNMLRNMGGSVGRTVVIGCEPAVISECMGLSPPVEQAVALAASLALETASAMAAELVGASPAVGFSTVPDRKEEGT